MSSANLDMSLPGISGTEIIQNPSEFGHHRHSVGWNQTAREYPRDKCVHQLFEEQAARTPDSVAVVFEDQSLTYAELNVRANQLARHLQSLGVEPEVLVGLCVERSFDMIVALLGILKAGGAYVPLDSELPEVRLRFLIADSSMPVVLTSSLNSVKLRSVLSDDQGQRASECRVVVLGDLSEEHTADSDNSPQGRGTGHEVQGEGAIETGIRSRPLPGAGAEGRSDVAARLLQGAIEATQPAYVNYTSGSTGEPRGVLVPHRAVVRLVK